MTEYLNSAVTTSNHILMIHRDTTIYQLLKKYPESIVVLKDAGLGCSNCMMSTFETIEEGALGHGWTQEDITALIETLNSAIGNRP